MTSISPQPGQVDRGVERIAAIAQLPVPALSGEFQHAFAKDNNARQWSYLQAGLLAPGMA